MTLMPYNPLGQSYIFASHDFWYFSRKPIVLTPWFNIIRPFETMAWIVLLASTLAVSFTFVLIYSVYLNMNPIFLDKRNVGSFQLIFKPALYLIEPDSIKWFSTKLSAGL